MQLRWTLIAIIVLYSFSTQATVLDPRRAWPAGSTLNVLFLDGHEFEHETVRDVANNLSRFANIKFNFYTERKSGIDYQIRIRVRTPHNASLVGTDSLRTSQTEPSMWLRAARYVNYKAKGTILHEFMHALGYRHEHQNKHFPYRWSSKYLKDQCIKPRAKREGIKVAKRRCKNDYQKLNRPFIHSHFDKYSVLMYEVQSGQLDGTFKAFKSYHELSDQDKRSLISTYSWTTPPFMEEPNIVTSEPILMETCP